MQKRYRSLSMHLLALMLGLLAAPMARAQDLLYQDRIWNGSIGWEYGYSVSGAGDIDGDGLAEVIAGAPCHSYYVPGYVEVSAYPGAPGWTWSWEGYPYTGITEYGFSVDGAGDVDGDGYDDLLIGALGGGPVGNGYVEIRSGRHGTVIYELWEHSHLLGSAVSAAGDVNADGFDDFLIGSASGWSWVYDGRTGAILYSYQDGVDEAFSGPVKAAGDVNADGFDDYIIGLNLKTTGELLGRVYSGRDGLIVLQTLGGWSWDGIGDVDGDGHDDLAVGDPEDGTGGVLRVLSGLDGSTLYSIFGRPGDKLGRIPAAMGDANRDGVPDVAFALGSWPGKYRVRVISGVDGSTIYTVEGPSDWHFGHSLDGAGDVNGDGRGDLVVGAPHWFQPWEEGIIYVISSRAVLLDSPTPGLAGGINTLRAVEATPGRTVYFIAGTIQGRRAVPGCLDAEVGIQDAFLVGSDVAAPDGTASLSGYVPASYGGRMILLQAVEAKSCVVSNLVTFTFP